MQTVRQPYPDKLKKIDAENERAKEIQTALDKIPKMTREEISDMAIDLNIASALGLVELKGSEVAGLNNITRKIVPDSPKELNVKAEVKTEELIVGFLQHNNTIKQDMIKEGLEYREVQSQKTAAIKGFTDHFVTDIPDTEMEIIDDDDV